MTALSTTDISDVLKETYPEGLDEELVMKSHALLALFPRDKEALLGRQVHIPVRYGKPQGRSHTFGDAQDNQYATDYEAFVLTSVSDYGVAAVAGEVVDKALMGGDSTQFLDQLKAEMDGALETLGDNLAKEAYRSTGGARGQVGAVATTSLTLKNIEDVQFFEIGMELEADTVDGGGTVHTGTATVTGINEDTGVLTTDSDWTSQISSLAVDDYLFEEGDYDNAAAGLDAWLPSTDPGATAFFGVNRSVSPQRLGGIRFDASDLTPEEIFIKALSRARRSGLKISHFFIHPENAADIELAYEGRKRIIDLDSEYDGVGFEGIKIGNFSAPLIVDPDCPKNVCYGVDMNTWTWYTQGDAPRAINADGLEMQRSATADSYEIRVVARHNFGCNAPGKNMRIALPTGN